MSNVTVTISGPVGSGKSAIYMEIMVALRAIGVPIIHSDEKAFQSEVNMGFGDADNALRMYRPTVTLVEQVTSSPSEVRDA